MYNLSKEPKNAEKYRNTGKWGISVKWNFETLRKAIAAVLTAAMLLPALPVLANEPGEDEIKPAAEEISIDKDRFPDDRFREHVKSFDRDKNGKFSSGELAEVTQIDVCAEGIQDLKGIEYFTELTSLYCAQNRLKNLDLSKNTKLYRLSCMKNNLTELNLRNNRELAELFCVGNMLKNLDLSQNTLLEKLTCNDNDLTELKLDNQDSLEVLSCKDNSLTELKLGSCKNLKRLACDQNRLEELDLSQNPGLIWLSCRGNRLRALNLDKNPALESVSCGENQLTVLDTEKNRKLVYLSCENNRIEMLNVRDCPNLTDLYCYHNQLTSLDVSKNAKIQNLYCYKNQLSSMDLRDNKSLIQVHCHNNRYKIAGDSIDFTTLPGTFDVSRVSSVQNGEFNRETNMFSFAEGQAEASYLYEMDSTHLETFFLVRSIFTDVKENAFYHDAALWALDRGIATGVGGTKFAPDEKCTRGQVVTFLWRSAGSPEPETEVSPFGDVQDPQAYYFKAVLWAAEKGITAGVEPDRFEPNGECTRGQVVTFLWRTREKPEVQNTVSSFEDVRDPSVFYYTPVLWATEQKITTGSEAGLFAPNGICSRGQIVTFLYRCMN